MVASRRFRGSIDQLAFAVSKTGLAGEWEAMPTGYWRFVCKSGALLNFWPQTGSFNFQGPKGAAAELENALAAVVIGHPTRDPARLLSGGG